MKRALILSYYWPPAGGPGVQRWLKMVKYLPQAGVEVRVLTVDAAFAEYPIRDSSLEKDCHANLQIRRTKASSFYQWYKRFTGAKHIPYSGFANEGPPNWKQKVSRFVRGNFFLPDLRKGWNRYALKEAETWMREERVDCIITTGPPMSTHLIGKALKRKFPEVQWIADFRDPWTDIYYYDRMYPTPPARAWDRRMEKGVLTEADAVIGVSPFVTRLLQSKLTLNSKDLQSQGSDWIGSKFHCITNGFDPEDYPQGESQAPSAFTLCYTGTMADNYPMDGLIQALEDLQKKHLIHFRLVGKIAPSIRERLSARIEHLEWIDFVPHHVSVRYLQESSLLLLVLPTDPGARDIIPGKVFEYIGSGTPVLCLGSPHADAAHILRECQAGFTCESTDSTGIRHFLEKQILQPRQLRYAADGNHPYARLSLAKRVAEEIIFPYNRPKHED